MQRGDDFYIRAFWELHSDRQFAGAPIPWSSIMAYAATKNLDREMTHVLNEAIRELDEELALWQKKQTR